MTVPSHLVDSRKYVAIVMLHGIEPVHEWYGQDTNKEEDNNEDDSIDLLKFGVF